MIIAVVIAAFFAGNSFHDWIVLGGSFEAQVKFMINLIMLFVTAGFAWVSLELKKIKKQIKANEKPTS